MARNIRILNLSRTPLRIDNVNIDPAKGNPAGDIVDLDNGRVRRDLKRFIGNWTLLQDNYSTDGVGQAPVGAPTIALGAETANVIAVTVQGKTGTNVNPTSKGVFDAWLGTSATDPTLVTTVPDGGLASGAAGKVVPYVAGKAVKLVTDATGLVTFTITESTAKSFYLYVQYGNNIAVRTITFA